MRIKTLRSLAIAVLLFLPDIPLWGFEFIPKLLGLVFIFAFSILLMEHCVRFTRPVVFSVIYAFVYVVRLAGLASAPWLVLFLNLLNGALTVLLILALCDAVAALSRTLDNMEMAGSCDRTGYIYTLHFAVLVTASIFPDLTNIMLFIAMLLTIYCVVMFFIFYRSIHTHVEAVAPPKRGVDIDEYEAALQDASDIGMGDQGDLEES